MGSRIPTKTSSPSRISRAATATMSSCGVTSVIAVVDRRRVQVAPDHQTGRVQPCQVFTAVGDGQHPLFQPPVKPFLRPRPGGVFAIGSVVAPPVALKRRR